MTIIATQPLRASLAVDRGGEGAAATNGGGDCVAGVDAGWGMTGDGLTEGDHVGDDQVGGNGGGTRCCGVGGSGCGARRRVDVVRAVTRVLAVAVRDPPLCAGTVII